jgi:Kef-type K+ transport system membrane component KefB
MDSLVQLATIWVGVLMSAFVARRLRLTPVLCFLGMGCVFANVGLLPSEPDQFIRGFADLGIIAIMFALGFDERIGTPGAASRAQAAHSDCLYYRTW